MTARTRAHARRGGTPWIVFSGSVEAALCERCGDTERPRLPMPIPAFVKWVAYFVERHRDCPEPPA